MRCSEPPIREDELERQLLSLIKEYALLNEWAAELLKMVDEYEREAIQSTAATVQELQNEIKDISEKLQRLLSAYLDQNIEREIYRSEKANLLSLKKTLEGKIPLLEQASISWLEPLKNWIKDAQTLNEIDKTTPVPLKKSSARTSF